MGIEITEIRDGGAELWSWRSWGAARRWCVGPILSPVGVPRAVLKQGQALLSAAAPA